MLKKRISKNGKKCRVTFELPAAVNAETATLCGEFNNWEKDVLPMRKLKSGNFTVATTLETGKEYRFRYWLDGERWENDWEADVYKANEFGTEDSVVIL